jgi:hypothetical protein
VSDLPAGDLLDSRTRQPIEVDNSNRSYVAPDNDDMFGGEPGSAYVNQ